MLKITLIVLVALATSQAYAGKWTSLIVSTVAVENAKMVPKPPLVKAPIADTPLPEVAPLPEDCPDGNCPVDQPRSPLLRLRSRFGR